jgi:hypothetical protein
MGALYDAITAIYADDTLSVQQKRGQARGIVHGAWLDNWLARNLPYTHTMTGGRVVTVRKVLVDPGDGHIKIYATYVKNGVVIHNDRVFHVRKPPILVPHASGEVTKTSTDRDGNVTTVRYKEDLQACALAWLEATFT